MQDGATPNIMSAKLQKKLAQKLNEIGDVDMIDVDSYELAHAKTDTIIDVAVSCITH